MKKASKLLWVLLALLLAATFGVLGCGDGDDDEGGGGGGMTLPDGYAWAWLEYTTADITPPALTTIDFHVGDGFDGAPAGGTLIMLKVILANDKAGKGAKVILDFSTGVKDSGVDDFNGIVMGNVKSGNYEKTATTYSHGGGFGCPAMSEYSVMGFAVKTAGLGDSRVEIGGLPLGSKKVALFSKLLP